MELSVQWSDANEWYSNIYTSAIKTIWRKFTEQMAGKLAKANGIQII